MNPMHPATQPQFSDVIVADDNAPLQFRGVSKRYGAKEILNDVSLSLEAGEIFGLIGLNGVGKTTLIKVLLDLVKADGGEASVFGVSSRHVSARSKLVYLPEKFQPSNYLTGKEYVSLTLSHYGQKLDVDAMNAMAQTLDLDPKALIRKVGGYSKGMGQKLGLLGAILCNQPLYILDEPMSGLDPLARIHLKAQLLEMKAQGKTIFFSSHILSDIDEICDRIGIIHDTALRFVGTPSEFRSKYQQDSLEKAFLSAINR